MPSDRRRLGRGLRIASIAVVLVVAGVVALVATGPHPTQAVATARGNSGAAPAEQAAEGTPLSNGWQAGGGFDIDKALHACGLSSRTAVQGISGSPDRIRADLSPTGQRLTTSTGLLTVLVPQEDGTFGALHMSDSPMAYRCPDFTEDTLHLVADFCDYLPRHLAPYTANPDSRWQSGVDAGGDLGYDPAQGDYGDGPAPLIDTADMARPHIYCGAARAGSEQAPNPRG